MNPTYVNVMDLCATGTRALGPGCRFVIWVQGCPFTCKGCISPEGIPIRVNQLMPIDELVEKISGNQRITGITISGGEPLLQASALTVLLREVRTRRPELDVIVFTGFRLRELDWPQAAAFLLLVDVLIDGRYVEQRNDNKGMRGSSNQVVHYLTERLIEHRVYFEERARSVEVHVYTDRQVIIGVPDSTITI